MEHEALTRAVIGAAMRVHSALGPGFLESVYQKALAWELRLCSVSVVCEKRLAVRYRGLLVGDFIADLVVDGVLVVELKADRTLDPAHAAQLVNYLTATRLDLGLLLNFGAARLQVRRLTRLYEPRSERRCDDSTG